MAAAIRLWCGRLQQLCLAWAAQQSALAWGFYALAVLLPLTFDLRLEDTFDLPKATVLHIGVMVLGWIWLRRSQSCGSPALEWMPLDTAVLARFAVAVICTVFSIYRYTSFMGNYKFYQDGLWSFGCYVVVYFLVSRCLSLEEAGRVLQSGVLVCFPVSIYAVIQGSGKDPFFPWMSGGGWVASSMGNPNFLGAFLCLMLPLGMARFILSTRTWTRWAWMIWLSFAFTALVLTRTRSAWLGFLVSMIVFFLLIRREIASRWKYVAVPLAVSFFLTAAYLSASKSARNAVMDRLAVFLDHRESSAHARLFHWSAALGAGMERPLLGSGLDTFAYVFSPHQDVASVRYGGRLMIASNAHNELLQVFATTGIIGLAAYIWFWIRWILTAKRVLAKTPGDDRIWIASLVSGMAALLTHAQFNFNVLTTWFYFWVITGVLNLAASKLSGAPRVVIQWTPRTGRIVAGSWAALALAAIWLSFADYSADAVFTQGLRLQNSGNLALAIQKHESALQMNPHLYPAYFHLGTSFKMLADSRLSDRDQVRRCLDGALAVFQKEVQVFPLSPSAHNNLAMAYMWRMVVLKEPQASMALREINAAARLGPAMPDIWDHMAQIYDCLGNKREALRAWGRALDAMPSYFPAWTWLHARLPEPPFVFVSQSVEVSEIPLGVSVNLYTDKGTTLRIVNDQEHDLNLVVDVLEAQDVPLVMPDGYDPLNKPGKHVIIPQNLTVKALSILPVPIMVQFPRSYRYRNRSFYCPIYIGLKDETLPSGRYAQLMVKTGNR